jgi:cold shock CspA family protein
MAYIDENGNISSTPPDPTKRVEINAEDIEIGVPRTVDLPDDTPRSGRVDYFNSSKGFGFIIQEDGERIFFHINQVNFQIKEGDWVIFEVEKGPKGLNAVGVSKRP